MTSSSPSPSAPRYVEVLGHCAKCHDSFSLDLRRVQRPDGTRGYVPVLTPRLALIEQRLIHRPDVCGGLVRLIGSLPD